MRRGKVGVWVGLAVLLGCGLVAISLHNEATGKQMDEAFVAQSMNTDMMTIAPDLAVVAKTENQQRQQIATAISGRSEGLWGEDAKREIALCSGSDYTPYRSTDKTRGMLVMKILPIGLDRQYAVCAIDTRQQTRARNLLRI